MAQCGALYIEKCRVSRTAGLQSMAESAAQFHVLLHEDDSVRYKEEIFFSQERFVRGIGAVEERGRHLLGKPLNWLLVLS